MTAAVTTTPRTSACPTAAMENAILTARQFSRRFQQIAARFRQLVDRADSARIEQLQYDFGSYFLEAANALESATDAGFVARWDRRRTQILATAQCAIPGPILLNGVPAELKSAPWFFEVLRRQTADSHRLCLLWTFCVGSYLAKEHPLRFPADAGERDWSHSRRDLSVPPLIEHYSDEEAAQLGLPLRTSMADADERVIKRWAVPEHGMVNDESALGESVGDEADERHRLRLRAEVYETACEVLAELIGGLGGDRVAPAGADRKEATGVMHDMVAIVDVVRAVGRKAGRSDKLASKMQRRNYPVEKLAGKNHCRRADAMAMFPHRKHLIEKINL